MFFLKYPMNVIKFPNGDTLFLRTLKKNGDLLRLSKCPHGVMLIFLMESDAQVVIACSMDMPLWIIECSLLMDGDWLVQMISIVYSMGVGTIKR